MEDGKRTLEKKSSGISEVKEENEIELPPTLRYHLSNTATAYLIKERKMSHEFLKKRNVRYVSDKESPLYNSIIFPHYDNNKKLIGYTSHNLNTKKYKNYGSLNHVPYENFINTKFPIVITEGIYDAGSVPNAIPLLGTKLYSSVLKFALDKLIVLALDKEVKQKEKKQAADNLLKYGAKKICIFDLDGHKDLNEYYVADEAGLKENLLLTFKQLIE